MYVSGLHSFQLSLKVYHRPLQQAVTFAETSHRCAYHHLGVLAKYGCSEKRRQLITTKSGHLDSTTAEAAAERGLRILRERSDAMKQGIVKQCKCNARSAEAVSLELTAS